MRLRRRQRQRQRRQRLRKLSNKLREAADGGVAEESEREEGEKAARATNTGTPRIEVGRKTRTRVVDGERGGGNVVEGTVEREALPDTRLGNQFRFLCLFSSSIHSFRFVYVCSFWLLFFSDFLSFFFALFGVSLIQALHNLRLN